MACRSVFFVTHGAGVASLEQQYGTNAWLWPNHELSQRTLLSAGSVSYFHNGRWSRFESPALRFIMASPAYLAEGKANIVEEAV